MKTCKNAIFTVSAFLLLKTSVAALIFYSTGNMIITLVILAIASGLFVSGKFRSDIIALCSLIALMLAGVLTPEEALSGFSNNVVIMMIGLFVVGGAIFQTGLAKMISSRILKLAGSSGLKLFLLVMLATASIGAFVSNTGTVALMLPIVVSLANNAGVNPGRLLMPLAFASSMGGMLTLIGTPPNLIISDTLSNAGYEPLSFFSFVPVGIICIVTGTLLTQLAREYRLSNNLYRLRAATDSKAVGKTIAELDVRNVYHLNVLEIRRLDTARNKFLKTVTQKQASANTVIKGGDVLYVTGDMSSVNRFAEDLGLALMDEHNAEFAPRTRKKLAFYNIGIAEILLMSSSRMINLSIREAGFRDKFNVNVLGVKRKKEYILTDLANTVMHTGDVLLVQGAWADIARLSREDTEWVVLGQPLEEAQKVTLDYMVPVAAAIMIAMIAMMVFDFIPVAPVTAVMIAAILMVVTGCLRNVEAAYKTINWETIVLFAAMLPMSLALEKTGVSDFVANTLAGGLGTHGPMLMMAGIYFVTSLMTMFISNTVTAVLMAPIALQSAVQIGVSPVPFLFAVAVAASMCFASPFSTPPNALVMKAGQYTFMDYIKVGLPLQVIMGIVMIAVLPLLFPF